MSLPPGRMRVILWIASLLVYPALVVLNWPFSPHFQWQAYRYAIWLSAAALAAVIVSFMSVQRPSDTLLAWRRTLTEASITFSSVGIVACLTDRLLRSGFNEDGLFYGYLLALLIGFLFHRMLRGGVPPSTGTACETCGYDLIGNVSGVCPECGTPVSWRVRGRIRRRRGSMEGGS